MWNILILLGQVYLVMEGNTPNIWVNPPKVGAKWQSLPDQYRKTPDFWDPTVNACYKEN